MTGLLEHGIADRTPGRILPEPLDRVTDPILVADDERTYSDVNQAAVNALGRSKEAIIGRSIDEVFSEADNLRARVNCGAQLERFLCTGPRPMLSRSSRLRAPAYQVADRRPACCRACPSVNRHHRPFVNMGRLCSCGLLPLTPRRSPPNRNHSIGSRGVVSAAVTLGRHGRPIAAGQRRRGAALGELHTRALAGVRRISASVL